MPMTPKKKLKSILFVELVNAYPGIIIGLKNAKTGRGASFTGDFNPKEPKQGFRITGNRKRGVRGAKLITNLLLYSLVSNYRCHTAERRH